MDAPFWADDLITLYRGDCLAVLPQLAEGSIDAVVTDPPYELSFMGRAWDASGIAYNTAMWRECLRVLRPGGHLLAFGGTRTSHRMTCAIEDAGFEVRDSLHWIYGSGFLLFPKSLNVGKAIDKAAGADREILGLDIARWDGWGTALKPSHEPIVLARKPLAGRVAANVLGYGTGALNVDGCRVGTDARVNPAAGNKPGGASLNMSVAGMPQDAAGRDTVGRWPPNVLLSHAADCQPAGTRQVRGSRNPPSQPTPNSGYGGKLNGARPARGIGDADGTETVQMWDCAPDCPVAELDRQSGVLTSGSGNVTSASGRDGYGNRGAAYGAESRSAGTANISYGDTGGASRFFPVFPFRYEAKAPASERPGAHPTVKPLAIMRFLTRLVTPPGGLVLDPFAGTGTTLEAAALEGFRSVGVERDEAYCAMVARRLAQGILPLG